MPLEVPKLDDRTYDELVEASLARLQASSKAGEWTDLSPSDPGRTLLELFAYLTETMLYRLNRLPLKLYVEFLRLMGVTLLPPAAAEVRLTFGLEQDDNRPESVLIPARTRVSLGSQVDAPVFYTIAPVQLTAETSEADVLAYHFEEVEEVSTISYEGRTRTRYRVKQGPILASLPGVHTLEVGVQVDPSQLDRSYAYLYHGSTPYRRWSEVETFANLTVEDRLAYTADRAAGEILFAPEIARETAGEGEAVPGARALAALPEAGRELLIRYWRGGGTVGNVPRQTLTTLLDGGLEGVWVTNRQAAAGGRDLESIEDAVERGAYVVHIRDRAITAQDYEQLVVEHVPGVVRAKVFTQAEQWAHGQAGVVEVLLVPDLPRELRLSHQITPDALYAHQTDATLERAREVLHVRRPLGVTLDLDWAHYKVVNVSAKVVTFRDVGSLKDIADALESRLRQAITPLPGLMDKTATKEAFRAGADRFRLGWQFGSSLHTSYLYDLMLSIPGVRWVQDVQLTLDDAPDADVTALASDHHQPATWFAGANGAQVFRSLNDGQGWELMQQFGPIEGIEHPAITRLVPDPNHAGRLAAVINDREVARAVIFFSDDCGHSWTSGKPFQVKVHDAAWLADPYESVLLLAVDSGVLRLDMVDGSVQAIAVDRRRAEQGYYAVTSFRLDDGTVGVAVAAQALGGVYVSVEAGRSHTFRDLGLQGYDVRHVAVQLPRVPSGDAPPVLWAAIWASGGDSGDGCFYQSLRGIQDDPAGWRVPLNWQGGSATALAFDDQVVYAASHGAGVLWADLSEQTPAWTAPAVASGLPLAELGQFVRIDGMALSAADNRRTLMVAGARGVYRASEADNAPLKTFRLCSARSTQDHLTLPPNYLFVAGKVDLDVRSEDETG